MKLFSKILQLAILTALFLPGCKSGELKEQVATLSEREKALTAERDSLLRLVVMKTQALDASESANVTLTTGKTGLEAKNAQLQSSLNAKNSQLQAAKKTGLEYETKISQENSKNDSLVAELNILHQKIRTIDQEISREQQANADLEKSLEREEERRRADSAAVANMPRPKSDRTGFVDIVAIGAGFGLGDTEPDFSRSLVSVTNIFGYEINRHFITGVGVGVHLYNGGTMIPLYLDMRYSFNQKKLSPFISADGGMMISLDKIGNSGLFVNPMIGVKRTLNEKYAFNLSGGILVQNAPAGVRNSFINFKGALQFRGK